MKKILIPIDFSDKSDVAIDLAVQIAKSTESSVKLLHVLNFPVLSESRIAYGSDKGWDKLMKECEKESREKMDLISKKYHSVDITGKTLIGSISDEILEYQKKVKFDVLILGTKVTYDIGSHFFGTFTDRIVHKSSIPVLVVKRKTKFSAIKKVIVGNAFIIKDEALAQKIQVVKSLFDAKIQLVRINTPTDFMSEDVFQDRVEKLKELDVLKDCSYVSLNFKNQGDGLVYHASKAKANMIVIGDKHSSTLRRWIVGEDLAEQVMDFSNLPVLIL
jgi:nucleotide-binding universal stress UspA family protein